MTAHAFNKDRWQDYLHDATLESIHYSPVQDRASMVFVLNLDDDAAEQERIEVSFEGVAYCVIEPPTQDPRCHAARVDHSGRADDSVLREIQPLERHELYLNSTNSFIRIGATSSRCTLLGWVAAQ